MVMAISLLDQILLLVFIAPVFIALTLFELITGRVERPRDYYRFYQSKRGTANRGQ